MSAALSQLPTRAKTLLDAADYFADLVVAEISDGSITARIQQALTAAGLNTKDGAKTIQPGLCVIVGIHGLGAAQRTGRGATGTVRLVAAVLENPPLNRSGKSALQCVEEVIRALSGQLTRADARPGGDHFAPAEELVTLLDDDRKRALYGVAGGIGYHVNFTATVAVRKP